MSGPRDQRHDFRDLSDDDLGALLRHAFAFPATPDMAASVERRVLAEPPPRRWRLAWPRLSRGTALALLALLLVAAVAGAAILGVPGIRILTIEQVDRPEPVVSAAPSDFVRVSRLGLGDRMTMEDVRARVEMPVISPTDAALGPPDELYLDLEVAGGMVSMVWTARPDLPAADKTGVGLLISQFDGTINVDGFQKLRDQDVELTPVSVAGEPGWWLDGASHVFLRRTGPGEQRPVVPTRLAGDTLLWERDGLTFRLEGSMGLERAIEIGASIGGNGAGAAGVVPS